MLKQQKVLIYWNEFAKDVCSYHGAISQELARLMYKSMYIRDVYYLRIRDLIFETKLKPWRHIYRKRLPANKVLSIGHLPGYDVNAQYLFEESVQQAIQLVWS